MSSTNVISPRATKSLVRRFNQLRLKSGAIDHDTAGFAVEVRNKFPKGKSGLLQFRHWVRDNLSLGRDGTTRRLVTAAHAFILFPATADWEQFGGYQSMSFLSALPLAERRRVVKVVRARLTEVGRPIGYNAVRNIALGLGITSKRAGRPNQTRSEAKVSVLSTYIRGLILAGVIGKNDLPVHVQDAMKKSALNKLKAAAQK